MALLLHRFVGIFIARKERLREMDHSQHYTDIYIKNLGDDFTDKLLKKTFETFGPVVSAVVKTDHHTGKSRGFGFVSYETHEAASMVRRRPTYFTHSFTPRVFIMHTVVHSSITLHIYAPCTVNTLFLPCWDLQAVESMNGAIVNGRTLYCGRAQKRKERMMEQQHKYGVEIS